MRAPLLVAALAALMAAGAAGAPGSALAQAPAPGSPRTMSFSWTLYPRMLAEVDLRFAADAEAVAEITAEGGEVSWNLHSHPDEKSPATFVVLGKGVGARVTVPCAPETPGVYSYLFGNDRGAGPVKLRIDLRLKGDVRLLDIRP